MAKRNGTETPPPVSGGTGGGTSGSGGSSGGSSGSGSGSGSSGGSSGLSGGNSGSSGVNASSPNSTTPVKRDSTPEEESSTILENIARYRAMAGNSQINNKTVNEKIISGKGVTGHIVEGTTIDTSGHTHHSGSFEDPNLIKEAQNKLYQAAGFIISHAETQDEKAVAEAVKYMMDNKKVQLDKVTARHEKENIQHSNTEKGFTDFYHNTETGEERGIIVIDTEKAKEEHLAELIETLAHEGWHVVQHERGRFEITKENNFKLYFKAEPGKTFSDYHADFEYEAFCMGLNMYNKYMVENGMNPASQYDWNQIKSIYSEK